MKEPIIEDFNINAVIEGLPADSIRYVDHAHQISKYIVIALKNQPRKTLADKLGKTEAEISKWLNGTHNFTLRTISKLEVALSIELINPKIKRIVEDHYNPTPVQLEPNKAIVIPITSRPIKVKPDGWARLETQTTSNVVAI